MKNVFNKFFTIVFAFFLLSVSTQTLSKQNVWTESFSQGTSEYFIESGDYWLLISCTDKDDEDAGYSSVSVYNTKTRKTVRATIDISNGHTFTLPVNSDSRMGTNNLLVLLDSLRSSDATVNFSGNSILFKKNTSNKIVPHFGKDFACKVF